MSQTDRFGWRGLVLGSAESYREPLPVASVNTTAVQVVLFVASVGAAVVAAGRWLRVAQRERYRAGSVVSFARRWWSIGPNRVLGVAAVLGLIGAAARVAPAGLATAAAVGVGPFGLPVRGRTSALVWTRRLVATAVVSVVMAGVVVGASEAAVPGWRVAAAAATLLAVAVPLLVDLGARATTPLRRRWASRELRAAMARLDAVRPRVVAFAGSYGRSTTARYTAHLVGGTLAAVTARGDGDGGLAVAVAERLAAGTEVLLAAVGDGAETEGASWVGAEVAVLPAISPDSPADQWAVVVDGPRSIVLCVDDSRLEQLADDVAVAGTRLWRVTTRDQPADVRVLGAPLRVVVHGQEVATVDQPGVIAEDLACAVAVALELGVAAGDLGGWLAVLPPTPHCREVTAGAGGVTVIDDTRRANPTGADDALRLLVRLAQGDRGEGPAVRRVVVTPGLLEPAPRPSAANGDNQRFGAAAARAATDLVVIGHTGGADLVAGWREVDAASRARLVRLATRRQADAWVARELGPGDVVLYENDLPDHFP